MAAFCRCFLCTNFIQVGCEAATTTELFYCRSLSPLAENLLGDRLSFEGLHDVGVMMGWRVVIRLI